jgi:copper transport protein
MRGIAALVAGLAVLAAASAANAHASLVRSEPADRAVVVQPPAALKLTFNEPVSPLALRLVRPTGEITELKGMPALDGATIVVTLPSDLSPGTHLLSWRVISADSHPVGGALTFSIGQPTAAPESPQASADLSLRAAIWLARLALYIGLFVGVGGAFFVTWVAIVRNSGLARHATIGALGCGLAAAAVSMGLHGVDVLGVLPRDIREPSVWATGLASAYGVTLCIAIAAMTLGLVATATEGTNARWCSALGLGGVGVALAASGHAATAGPELLTRLAVFLHGVTVAFWLGALLPLAATLHDRSGLSDLKRFSKAIPWPLFALVGSGVLLAIVQVRQIEGLWTTAYGVVLCCKLVAIGLLLALASKNRWLTPRVIAGDAGAARRLVRSIVAEAVIVMVILGLVSSWRFTPPPRALLVASRQPIHAHIHTGKAMADLQIEGSGHASQRMTLTLLDEQFAPLTAKEVTLILSRPDLGIEPLRFAAAQMDVAMWQIDGIRLPISGRWNVRIEVLINDFEKTAIEDEIDLLR